MKVQSLKKNRIQDVCVVLFWCWIMLDSLYLNERLVSGEKLALFAAAFLLYICSRMMTILTDSSIATGLCVAGIVESAISWGQYCDIMDSNHLSFDMTGSFFNPAHLGALTGLSLISTFYLIYHNYIRHRIRRSILYSLAALWTGSVFILAFSRASWIALALICIFPIWTLRNKYRLILPLFALFILLTLPLLYHMKKPSADGRLFIWKVSGTLLKDSPIWGKGADSFSANYMLAQAKYFETHPNSFHAVQATDNTRAFNEFLRIACEYGIIGLGLLLLILYAALTCHGSSYIRLLLLYLCVFSCFSYFMEIPIFILLSSFLLGYLPVNAIFQYTSYKKVYYGIFFFTGGLFFLSLACHAGYIPVGKKEYNRAIIMSTAKQLYAHQQYSHALPYLQQSYHLIPVSEICMDLGNCHYYLKNYTQAEFYLTKARWMVPAHILPRYYLFRLYCTMEEMEKAHIISKEILMGDFKKEGSIVMEVKQYLKEYLDRHPIVNN